MTVVGVVVCLLTPTADLARLPAGARSTASARNRRQGWLGAAARLVPWAADQSVLLSLDQHPIVSPYWLADTLIHQTSRFSSMTFFNWMGTSSGCTLLAVRFNHPLWSGAGDPGARPDVVPVLEERDASSSGGRGFLARQCAEFLVVSQVACR